MRRTPHRRRRYRASGTSIMASSALRPADKEKEEHMPRRVWGLIGCLLAIAGILAVSLSSVSTLRAAPLGVDPTNTGTPLPPTPTDTSVPGTPTATGQVGPTDTPTTGPESPTATP